MRAIRYDVLVLALTVAAAACGGDGGSGPAPVDLSGTWYGTADYSTATCDGALPAGIGTDPFSFPQLFEVSQAGSQLTALDLTDTLHYVGSVDVASGGLAARFQARLDGADHVDVTDTLTVTASGNPLHLDATGTRTDAIDWTDPQQPDRICTRTITWNMLRRTTPVPELARLDCSQEAILRPSGTLSSDLIVVDNGSTEAVDIYRLDQAGARVLVGQVAASEKIVLGAIGAAAEPLVFATTDGTCRGIYLTVEGPAYVHFS